MQILEYFDDAPDDSANWGNAISSIDEIRDSSDNHGSQSSDTDNSPKRSDNVTKVPRKRRGTFNRKVTKTLALEIFITSCYINKR